MSVRLISELGASTLPEVIVTGHCAHVFRGAQGNPGLYGDQSDPDKPYNIAYSKLAVNLEE